MTSTWWPPPQLPAGAFGPPQGWQCPTCQRCHAPFMTTCPYCPAQVHTWTGPGTGPNLCLNCGQAATPNHTCTVCGDPPGSTSSVTFTSSTCGKGYGDCMHLQEPQK